MGAALAISAVALLFLGVNSLILWRRTVNGTNSRNDGSGIRTQATKTSDAAWNAGHKAAVPLLRTFGFSRYPDFCLAEIDLDDPR